MKQKPNYNSIIAKDNSLIEKMAKFELSELRLIAYCLAHYDSRGLENRSLKAKVNDLAALFPMDKKSAYAVVRKAMLGINKKPLEFREGNKRHFWNWFSGFTYTDGDGEFEFRITPEIQPYLLALKGTFTKYRLADVYQFRAASTWKMYELLKRWQKSQKWSVNLDELRLLLGVAGKYPRWSDFQVRIIDPSTKEINDLSDLSVNYEQEKQGRKIVGLVFFIDKKIEDDEIINLPPPEDELYKLLLTYGINCKTAQDYAKKINDQEKSEIIIPKLPAIAERAKKSASPVQKYILGAIKNELSQMSLFNVAQQKTEKPNHTESLDCWTEKRQKKEVCPIRQRGQAGQRKKCQICLEKIPLETFGL